MNKARSYVKSVIERGSLARAFLARAWGKLLCRWNWHDDGLGQWYDLAIELPKQGILVGSRLEFTCSRCQSKIHCDSFNGVGAQHDWVAFPELRRVLPREVPKP